jgi:flavin reductase (DIM6/NTAB) family NADH-FMN oxidoreductase RutF
MAPTGKSTNLAPFSYFNVINHDPPLFIFGFAGGLDRAKDSLKNLIDSKECEKYNFASLGLLVLIEI